MKKYTFIFLFILSASTVFLVDGCTKKILINENKKIKQTENEYKSILYSNQSIKYLLYLPKDYDEKDKLPLILFLHGAGSKGDNLKLLRRNAIPKMIEEGSDFQFIIVSPQCAEKSHWEFETPVLEGLLNNICENYKVDEDRIYVTGLSMGGYGTWALAIKCPQKFAAIIPVCGGGDTSRVCDIGSMPVWAFHGAKDNIIPISETQNLVDKLKSCGGNVEFTIYPDGYHNIWDNVYSDKNIYNWLLDHKKIN